LRGRTFHLSSLRFQQVVSPMLVRRVFAGCLSAAALIAGSVCADDAASARQPDASFANNVAPFLQAHCNKCHGGKEPEAKLGLDKYRDSANIQQDFALWEKVLRILEARQMPPADEPQPTGAELQDIVRAIEVELAKFDCTSERHPGHVTLRRLNRAEYNNTIRDLVGVDFRPADDFPADDVGNGFDNIGDVLSIPPILLEKYLAAAERVIDDAFSNDALKARILVHKATNDDERRTVNRRNIATFATKAFRRPVTDEELERLNDLRRAARTLGYSDDEILKVPYQAILASPHFLFRVEQDPTKDDAHGIRALNDYELASRLSYFLWSTMPDAELFELAKLGKLHEPAILEVQARRMLQDAKSQALIDNFAGQWLQLRDVAKITPDPERYPGFDEDLRTAMLRETQLFFAAVMREDRSVLEFLSADFTYVNARLARHYGMANVSGDEFQRVALDTGRRGLLTQASILTLTSNPTRTSPVKRGKWILENMLGEPPPPPPAGVEELKDDEELLGTLRERMEQHRTNESCAVCHRQMDTLGFGLENFDGIGAWRAKDGRFEIDPSGTLPGGKGFRDAGELMQLLAQQKKEAFSRCLTEKMLTYALGRGLVGYDRCAVQAIQRRLAANDFRFSALVVGIVASDPFLLREAKGEP
jgi:mono/diheme cytochrome c family protein